MQPLDMVSTWRLRCALAAVLIVALAGPAAAQGEPRELAGPWGAMREEAPAPKFAGPAQGTTYVRRHQMRAISAHYRSIEATAALGAPPQADIAADAAALLGLAENLPRLFAIRSPRTGDTGAKAAIWDEPELFAEHVAGFQAAARGLHASAQSSDHSALVPAVNAVRYQCLACHHHYRRSPGRPGVEGRRGP